MWFALLILIEITMDCTSTVDAEPGPRRALEPLNRRSGISSRLSDK